MPNLKSRPVARRLLEVLLVAVLVVAAVRWFGWYTAYDSGQNTWHGATPAIRVGDTFVAPGVSGERRHLLLVISTTCPACNADRPFYRQLSEAVSKTRGIDFTVVSREAIETVRAWLEPSGIRPHRISRMTRLGESGIVFTPTILITTQEGIITDMVQRAVAHNGLAAAMLQRITAPLKADPLNIDYVAQEIAIDEYLRAPMTNVQIVDVRERGRRGGPRLAGAVAIPADELAVRARAELDVLSPLAIDCTEGDPAACRLAGADLLEMGFSRVVVVVPTPFRSSW
jgi:hypothetical protein